MLGRQQGPGVSLRSHYYIQNACEATYSPGWPQPMAVSSIVSSVPISVPWTPHHSTPSQTPKEQALSWGLPTMAQALAVQRPAEHQPQGTCTLGIHLPYPHLRGLGRGESLSISFVPPQSGPHPLPGAKIPQYIQPAAATGHVSPLLGYRDPKINPSQPD